MNPNKFDKLQKIRKSTNSNYGKSSEQCNIESRKYKINQIFVKGIYRLYNGSELVYIGQSKDNVMKRICDHYYEGIKLFDSFTFSSCLDMNNIELDEFERKLINKYLPKYNILNKNMFYDTIKSVMS